MEMEHIKFKYPATAIATLWTPCSTVLFDELLVPQLVKKFSTFYETPRLITVFTKACHLPLPWVRQTAHILLSYFLQVHLKIILPPTPRSSKWFLSFRFPHHNPVCISLLSHTHHMPHSSHPPWLVRGTKHEAPNYAVFSSILLPPPS